MYEGNDKEGFPHEKVKAQKEKFLKIIDFFGKKGNGKRKQKLQMFTKKILKWPILPALQSVAAFCVLLGSGGKVVWVCSL